MKKSGRYLVLGFCHRRVHYAATDLRQERGQVRKAASEPEQERKTERGPRWRGIYKEYATDGHRGKVWHLVTDGDMAAGAGSLKAGWGKETHLVLECGQFLTLMSVLGMWVPHC